MFNSITRSQLIDVSPAKIAISVYYVPIEEYCGIADEHLNYCLRVGKYAHILMHRY